MDLKQRLQVLRRQGADPADGGPSRDVRTRLDRLGTVRRKPVIPKSDSELAAVLGGEVVADGLVECEQSHELGSRVGRRLAECLRDGLPDAVSLPSCDDWVFLDTETTGLAGGSGTLVFLIGLARVRGDALVVRQFLATRFAGEAAMLRRAAAWLGDAGLISYNGKTFDCPLLTTRCRLTRQPDWLQHRAHLDLLYPVRRAFADRWPDCRLATAERQLLSMTRAGDLPGSEAPAAWLAHVRAGDASGLSGVLGHNAQDLVSLARLMPQLAGVYAAPEAFGANPLPVARAWSRRGRADLALAVLERNAAALTPDGLHDLALQYRRAGDWRGAAQVWRGLAEQRDDAAIERLAKLEEHVLGNPVAAERWASRLPPTTARDRRLQRLARKGRQRTVPLPFD